MWSSRELHLKVSSRVRVPEGDLSLLLTAIADSILQQLAVLVIWGPKGRHTSCASSFWQWHRRHC
jgi:hypothetical protein